MPLMNPYPVWTKYRQFKTGDLVQIDHGNRPLGIIHGLPKPRYTVSPRSMNWTGGNTNYLEYPVLISDVDETKLYDRWYWPGGLYHRMYWDDDDNRVVMEPGRDPLIAYIHPSYLIFLTES